MRQRMYIIAADGNLDAWRSARLFVGGCGSFAARRGDGGRDVGTIETVVK